VTAGEPTGIEIFNLLHDGLLKQIEGRVPGDITFLVECDYLRQRIADPGRLFLIKISQCADLRLEENPPDATVVRDPAKIASMELWILSAECINSEIVIYTGAGQIIFSCSKVSVLTNVNTPLKIEDLDKVAREYWTEWANAARAGRLMFICERLLTGKDSITAAIKAAIEWKLDKLDGDVDQTIINARDELMHLDDSKSVSLEKLKGALEILKTKFPNNVPAE
jgi:hypothetical protein